MGQTVRTSMGRNAVLVVLVAGAWATFGVSAASALPGIGAPPRAAISGPVVSLGCANPANAGITGRVLGAAQVSYGGSLRCFGEAIASGAGRGPEIMPGPTGLGPTQIQSAYDLAGLDGEGRTVAVVDAYDDPDAAANLAIYRTAYGLPACTTANGCFTKVNQAGAASPLPTGDYGWAEEESLDLDTISATCPTCRILLVEANSTSSYNLGTAENTAARAPGVVAISNSYGGDESAFELLSDYDYRHPGIAITAATGDSGYGAEYPAASPYVTAVGGTTLATAANARGWTETAWARGGSGCSAFEPKPAWQHDTGCTHRTIADVSADADPDSGLGIYDTYNPCGASRLCDILIDLGYVQGLDGWVQVGGTSLSSPLVASVYALAGNTASVDYGSAPYADPSALFDVTSGANGVCVTAYLCNAGPGYDGPTGLGTPDGTAAF